MIKIAKTVPLAIDKKPMVKKVTEFQTHTLGKKTERAVPCQ